MKLIAILGSRNHEGQTAQAVNGFMEGAVKEGDEVKRVFLPELTIERCRQCDAEGWGLCRYEHRCVIEDDFAFIVDALREADAAVFGVPVYFSDLSESMSAFLTRLCRVSCWEGAGKDIKGTPAVGICVAGGGGGGAPTCVATLERWLSIAGLDVLDLIPARRQNLDLKVRILKTTGEWFAEQVAQSAS